MRHRWSSVIAAACGVGSGMLKRLEMAWRVAATGFCFASFGVGGLLLRVLIFPLLHAVAHSAPQRSLLAKRVVHACFRLFVGTMRGLGVLSYDVVGMEKLQRDGLLILANHPSLIDIVFMISLVPRADCVVKSSLRRNPFTAGPVRAAGYICNDSGPAVVQACIESVRQANNLIIFPEGTRTPASGTLTLRRGAANIAIRGKLDITPVTIQCVPPVLTKGEKWYDVPRARPHFKIEVQNDIPVLPFMDSVQSEAIAARRLTEYLTSYFDGKNQERRHADAGERD